MTDSDDAFRSQPRQQGEPVFREPWEAGAFAMAVKLSEQGYFTWKEWAETLAEVIGEAGETDPDDTGERYYHHWLAALERLVESKRLATSAELARTRESWRRAYAHTPHGQPVKISTEED